MHNGRMQFQRICMQSSLHSKQFPSHSLFGIDARSLPLTHLVLKYCVELLRIRMKRKRKKLEKKKSRKTYEQMDSMLFICIWIWSSSDRIATEAATRAVASLWFMNKPSAVKYTALTTVSEH